MTTGKNKEAFEKWYKEFIKKDKSKSYQEAVDNNPMFQEHFYDLDFEMQIGVYEAYYDSLGGDKYIPDYDVNMCSWFVWIVSKGNRVKLLKNDDGNTIWFKSRKAAQISMLEKANELLNEKLK